MGFQNFFVQFAFLYAPLLHCDMEQVTPSIWRGPDPKIKNLQCIKDKGIKTIISCRTNPQRNKRLAAEKLGIKWIQLTTGVFKVPTDAQMDQFRAIVNDPKNQPVYTCCEIDMDRTAVYLAAYRMVDQHWTAEQMDAELHAHHQKRWWPVFRKYQAHVIAYAKKHEHDSSAGSLAQKVDQPPEAAAPLAKEAAALVESQPPTAQPPSSADNKSLNSK